MSTRRTTTVTEEAEPEEGEIIEVTDDLEAEEAQLDALDGMIAEFTGAADTVVNVYRQGEGRSLSFLFRTNPDEMSGGEIMEKCRDNYGTGDFRVHIRSGARLVKNAPFSVEAKKEPDPATLQAAQGMGTVELIAMMQENNKQTMLMFTEAMKAFATNQNNAPAFDPVAAQASLMSQLAALKQMSEPKDTSNKAVEMLIQGLTLAKDLNPREGETNSSDILLEGIKQFAPALTNAAQQMQGRTVPGNGAPLLPADPQAAADAEREREMGIRTMMQKQQLGFLVQNAAANKNAELYAELLLDQLGEKIVLEFVGQPDAMEKLIAINSDVGLYRGWFEALRVAILELTGQPGDTGMEGVIIPAPPEPETGTDAIPDAAIDGDITSDPVGTSGDTPNA